jgi:hypothetical protein
MTLLASAALAQPRISFTRRIPPRYDFAPADEIVIVYAIGDNDSVETFVDEFAEHANRWGPVHLTDLTAHGAHFVGQKPDERTIRRLRREHPADAYMGVNRFTCETTTRDGEGSTTNFEGARVRRKYEFIDAICRARIEVLDAQSGGHSLTFDVMGEGTSPRVEKVSDEERKIALGSAARYAAIVAAEAISQRDLRETIDLDPNAPYFDRGMAIIDASRPLDARALWERVLAQNPRSAPLLSNLAAVSEATGDLAAACDYLERAMTASPKDRRYRTAMEMFRRRNGK